MGPHVRYLGPLWGNPRIGTFRLLMDQVGVVAQGRLINAPLRVDRVSYS